MALCQHQENLYQRLYVAHYELALQGVRRGQQRFSFLKNCELFAALKVSANPADGCVQVSLQLHRHIIFHY